MREKRRKITVTLGLVAGLFVAGNLMPQNSLQAQAATAKKTVKVTLDTANPDASISLITIPKKPKVSISNASWSVYKKHYKKNRIKIEFKILKVKGKTKGKKLIL